MSGGRRPKSREEFELTETAIYRGAASRRVLWVVAALVLLDFLAVGFIAPLVPGMVKLLLRGSLDYGTVTGFLLALNAGLQFLSGAFLGALADRFGRKPVFLLSIAGIALANIVRGTAPDIQLFALGTVLSGTTSATTAVALATVTDVTAPDKRASAFGLVGGATGAGFVLGPVLGGLAAHSSLRIAYICASLISILTALLAFAFLPETHPKEKRAAFSWKRANPIGSLRLITQTAEIGRLALGYFILQAAIALFPACFALFVVDRFGWDTAQVGFSVGVLAVVFLITQAVLIGPAVDRLGAQTTGVLALMVGAAGFTVLCASQYSTPVVAALVAIGMMVVAQPTLKATLSTRIGSDEQGELQGALEGFSALARVVSPLLFGALYSWVARFGHPSLLGLPFALTAFTLIIGAVLAWRIQARAETRES